MARAALEALIPLGSPELYNGAYFTAMARFASDSVVVARAAQALYSLPKNVYESTMFAAAGGISLLYGVLARHTDDFTVVRFVLGCLSRTTLKRGDNFATIGSYAAAIPLIQSLLSRHAGASAIIGLTTCLLIQLAGTSLAFCPSITSDGTFSLLLAALARYPDAFLMALSVPTVLFTIFIRDSPSCCSEIVSAGGIPLLNSAMARHADEVYVAHSAAGALSYLSKTGDYAVVVIFGSGGVTVLLAALTHHPDEIAAVCCITRVLRFLSVAAPIAVQPCLQAAAKPCYWKRVPATLIMVQLRPSYQAYWRGFR